MAFPSQAAARAPPLASILVVDDDDDFRIAVTEVLEDEGYHVQSAADGRSALALLEGGSIPDLVLTDLLMPVLDGWQLIAALKESPALAKILVVVISGAGERTLVSAPVSAGYVEKPLSPARLLETLAATLARRERKSSGVVPRP